MENTIAHMLGSLEAHLKGVKELLADMRGKMLLLDKRLSLIERQIYLWKGAVSILLLLLTFLGTILSFVWK